MNNNLVPLPASVKTVALFIAFLARKSEYTTIVNYTAGIASYHWHHDVEAPDLSSFIIRQALAGVRRQRRELPYKRNAILPSHLTQIRNVLPLIRNKYRATFWAACVVAFFTLLRSSNLFKNYRSSKSHLRVVDLTCFAAGYRVKVPVLKTNRFLGASLELVLLQLPPSHPLCPVVAIENMLRRSGARGNDPLFSYRDGDTLTHFSATRFNAILRAASQYAGISETHVSTHSFRRGAATFASSVGIPAASLKAQGNWRSSCYEQYVSLDGKLRTDFACALADALR